MQECTAQLCQDAGNTDFSIMTPIILESSPREPPAPHQGAALPLKECHSSHKQLLWHRNMFVSQQVTKALSQGVTPGCLPMSGHMKEVTQRLQEGPKVTRAV